MGYRESTEINKRKDIVCLLGFYSNRRPKLNIQNNGCMRSKINVPLKMIVFLLKTCVIVSEWIKLQKGVKVQTGKYFKINERTRYLQAGNLTRNKTELLATHYRRSPLFQGGLEIPCIVKITMPASVLGHLLLKRYEELVLKL